MRLISYLVFIQILLINHYVLHSFRNTEDLKDALAKKVVKSYITKLKDKINACIDFFDNSELNYFKTKSKFLLMS